MKMNYKFLKVDVKDGIALITMNNPPVNQFSANFTAELKEAVTGALEDEKIKALILTGTGKNFVAGADITEVQQAKKKEEVYKPLLALAQFFSKIETNPKPVIAAINGTALGGGLELAMACHYRIAVKGASLGQPEVQIGLIPGAGGTQRLPRLVGLQNGLEMITTGAPIKAERALARALVDEVVDESQLIDAAFKAAGKFLSRQIVMQYHTTRFENHRIPTAAEKKAVMPVVKMMTAQKAKGYPAPLKAIEAIEKGLTYDIDKDIEREVGIFSEIAVSPVAKNLIGIFLNTRSAGRLPRIEKIKPAKIKKVAMLGGGVMGSGIVNLLLANGFEAVLWDINDKAIEKGVAAIRKTFDYPIKKKKLTKEGLDAMIQKQFKTTTSFDVMKDVDLVIEAVLEDMKIKQDIWKKLEGICRPDTVFGTNTSALPITEMATVLKDPGRMIGLHFFNPAERMQLLEIICTKKTSDQTLATSVAFGREIKKVPIVVNDGPGFYVSRQLGGLMGGFIYLLADGVELPIIEQAMVDFGMPMGPATLGDLTGIDINHHVQKTFERTMGERYKVHPLIERVYATGCYGRKTGSGWYDYSSGKPVPNPKVMGVLEAYLRENKVKPKKMSNQEIVDMMLANAINEAAYMIQEDICDRPQDMDLAMIYGTGFPPYRGGILRYSDAWGIKNVSKTLKELEGKYGVRFKAAKLITDMAKSGKTFYKD